VVLPATLSDLQGAQPVPKGYAFRQRPAEFQAMQQGAAKCVSATGRVHHLLGGHAGHAFAHTLHPHIAAIGSQRDDQALQMRT